MLYFPCATGFYVRTKTDSCERKKVHECPFQILCKVLQNTKKREIKSERDNQGKLLEVVTAEYINHAEENISLANV